MGQKLLLLASNIPAAIAGGGIFLIALFVLNLGVPVALLLAVAGYLISGLFILPAKPVIEKKQQEMLRAAMKDGKQKTTEMRTLAKSVKKPKMREKIVTMSNIAENIFEAVEKNPLHVKSAEQFCGYYLDTTIKIIKKYLTLSEHQAYSEDVQSSLIKVEEMLDNIQPVFEKQLSSILSDEVLDLDTELSVMEEAIEIENL